MAIPVEEMRELDVRDIAERLGIDTDRSGMSPCVAHPDGGRPNMKVYPRGVKCFRCDFSADGIGLVEHVLGVEFVEAVRWLASEAVSDVGRTHTMRKRKKNVLEGGIGQKTGIREAWGRYCELAHEQMIDVGRYGPGLRYAAKRGIKPETVGMFELGCVLKRRKREVTEALRDEFADQTLKDASLLSEYNSLRFFNRLIFPFKKDGRVVAFQGRTIDNVPPRYMGPSGATVPLFNIDVLSHVDPGHEPVWVCEGPLDTVVVSQTGRTAVGIPGVSSARYVDFVNFANLDVVVCMDGDPAGKDGFRKITSLLHQAGCSDIFYVEFPPGMDAAEWDWSEGRPEIQRWER